LGIVHSLEIVQETGKGEEERRMDMKEGA